VLKEVEIRQAIKELSAALPATSIVRQGDDLDLRARAVLALLIEKVAENASRSESQPIDVLVCPNCGQPATSNTSPYCSDCCREQAAFIRQMRDRIRNRTLLEPQSQVMKGEQMWRLLGGGLPRRLALVPESARQRVFKRSEGKCEICGAPATTIDNTGSG